MTHADVPRSRAALTYGHGKCRHLHKRPLLGAPFCSPDGVENERATAPFLPYIYTYICEMLYIWNRRRRSEKYYIKKKNYNIHDRTAPDRIRSPFRAVLVARPLRACCNSSIGSVGSIVAWCCCCWCCCCICYCRRRPSKRRKKITSIIRKTFYMFRMEHTHYSFIIF